MKPPEEVLRELVGQWVAKADIDHRAAQALIRGDDPVREAVAFHCQQSAEKYLKAFLVWHQVEFPKTHNLRQLLGLVGKVAPDLSASLQDAAALTPYGVDLRYPGDFPDVIPGQDQELLALATKVRDAVLVLLRPYLLQR